MDAQRYLKMGAFEQKGNDAKMNAFFGCYTLSDTVKTTMGPKGMDKILRPHGPETSRNKIIVTNDGATILSHMQVDNPAAKVLVDISKTQDEEVGDGTTTVCVLAGELLREAEKLFVKKIHPLIIIEGWRKARDCALKTLRGMSLEKKKDEEAFREDLMKIARTCISSKLLKYEKEHFANLAVNAVLRLKGEGNLEHIQIIKKLGSSLKDSFLDDGFLLEKEISIGCPTKQENARVLIANTPMDYDKIKIFGTRVKVKSMDKVAEIEAAEKEKMKEKVDKILKYKPDIFINRQLIYNYPEQLFAEKGITVIEHADFEGVERLAKALGAEILSTFDTPDLADKVLGQTGLLEEIMIGEDKLIRFSGNKLNESCSIVLRGSSSHLLDEAERSLHDALCVLVKTVKDREIIYGGGNSELMMANAIDDLSKDIQGKQVLAVRAFARALRTLPLIIADNGGYDSAELVENISYDLRHGKKTHGLDMENGIVGCMETLGIYESMRIKEQAIISATEASEMILRIDDIIFCAPRERKKMGVHN